MNQFDICVVFECFLFLTFSCFMKMHMRFQFTSGLVFRICVLCEALLQHTLDQLIRIFYGCGFREDVEVFLRICVEHSSFSAFVDTFCKSQAKTFA